MKQKKITASDRALEPFLSPSATGGTRVWRISAYRYRIDYDFDIRDLAELVSDREAGKTPEEHKSLIIAMCSIVPLLEWLGEMVKGNDGSYDQD